MTPTWFEHAAFWSGVRRATVAPRSHNDNGVKKIGSTEIWTRIAGFKVQSANHYTMGPYLWNWLKIIDVFFTHFLYRIFFSVLFFSIPPSPFYPLHCIDTFCQKRLPFMERLTNRVCTWVVNNVSSPSLYLHVCIPSTQKTTLII